MTNELFVVELKHLPLAILRDTEAHNQTLMRELALVHTADEAGSAPARLLWLSQQLDGKYAEFDAAPRERLQRAIDGDDSHIDIRYEVPGHAADAAADLGSALDEVDEYCRQGDLLTLVTPPAALAFRRWLLDEFVSQIRDGVEPTPWSTELVGAPLTAGDGDTPSTTAGAAKTGTIVIDDDLDLEGAARVRGEIAGILDGGVLHLTVDLGGCHFIDSVGISLLLTTRERLRQANGTLILENVAGAARSTLETTGIYAILTTKA